MAKNKRKNKTEIGDRKISEMILIHRATIINEGRTFEGSVLIEGEKIKKIFYDEVPKNVLATRPVYICCPA
jgi:hypothetical protein